MSTPPAQPFDENEWQKGAQGAPRFEFEEVSGDKDAESFDARDYEAPHRAEFADFDDREQSSGARFKTPFPEPPAWESAAAVPANSDSRMWASLSHVAGAAGVLITGGTIGWLAPLLIWLTRRDYDSFAAEQAKEALNFQITTVILSIIAGILCFILIGFPMLLGLILGNIIFSIVGAIKVHGGEPYRYPYNIRMIR